MNLAEKMPPRMPYKAATGRSWQSLRRFWPYLFLLPTFFFLIAFAYGPFLKVIVDSFYSWDGAFIRRFIGLGNFQRALFEDQLFWPSIGVALQLTATSLIKIMVFPLLAAVMIHRLRVKR